MKRMIAMLLAAAMLGGQTAPAGGTETDAAATAEEVSSEITFIDAEALDEGIESVLKDINSKSKYVSVALEFTATGETYYYNADRWIYTASLCKLPVAMTFANMLKNGELEKDVMQVSDTEALEKILAHSNYSWYSKVACRIYGRTESKEQRMKDLEYSGFDESLLPDRYVSLQRYSARFYLGIIQELYNNPDEYPEVLDYMKQASPNRYFNGKIGEKYVVAQKYGSDRDVVHSAGVIYTDCPILLVIMTSGQKDASGNRIIENLSEYLAAQASEWSTEYLNAENE